MNYYYVYNKYGYRIGVVDERDAVVAGVGVNHSFAAYRGSDDISGHQCPECGAWYSLDANGDECTCGD